MQKNALPTLSLGFDFADPRVTSDTYRSTRTLLDYEVAIWNPVNLLDDYEGHLAGQFQGLPSLNDDSSFAIGRDVVRRRREMEQFLALGKTLIVFLPPPMAWFVATGEKQHSGTGRNRQTTRIVDEKTLYELFPFELSSVLATGQNMRLVVGEPFSTFWREYEEWFSYSAYMNPAVGTPLVVIEGTNYAIASVANVESGTVVLLPQLQLGETLDEDYVDESDLPQARKEEKARAKAESEFLNHLLDLVRELRANTGDFTLPEWAQSLVLPGDRDITETLRKDEERLDRLLQKIDGQKQGLALANRRKLLFTGTGVSLELLVEQAFEALGCAVESGEPGRTDRIIRHQDKVAVVEIKGKVKSATEANAAQLEKWVSEYQIAQAQVPKGVLLVNAWRNVPLRDRNEPAFPHQMLQYSAKRDHCLITGLQLLGAWLDAEANPGKAVDIARSILECVGVYERYLDWRAFLEVDDSEAEADAPRDAQRA